MDIKTIKKEQYIQEVMSVLSRKTRKMNVVGYLKDVCNLDETEALSLVYTIEDLGLATNLGKGFMIVKKK